MKGEKFCEDVKAIIGLNTWKPKLTHGAAFFLDFGESVTRQGESTNHGEYHFLFQLSDWRLIINNRIVTGSMDSTEEMAAYLGDVELGVVKRVDIGNLNDLELEFGTGHILQLTNNTGEYGKPSSIWSFYMGETASWGLSSTGELTFEV